MELHGNTFKKENGTMAMAPLLPASTQSQCWTFARSSSTPSNPSRPEALRSTQSPVNVQRLLIVVQQLPHLSKMRRPARSAASLS